MKENRKKVAVQPTNQRMSVQFIGLKCPVCGKTLLKIRAQRLQPLSIKALLPEQGEEAIASVKCPCHGGAVPIAVIDERSRVYRANTAK